MNLHFIGIDFGTCNSSMAWFNPKTGHAETLLNAEGEDKTPSVVYYGEKEILVGKYAEEMLEHRGQRTRIVTAAKRELAKRRVWMLGTRNVTPVDVAAQILAKLKRDAEETHFHEPISRAVITCPAVFDEIEKDKLREAADCAGFKKIELLEEPVAAAIAYTQAGVNVGQHVLVYDLGGGTFDLAMLVREGGDNSFRLALEPRGNRIGGEDFDRSIYDHYDDRARKKFNEPICADGIDLHLLRQCRRFKENLSVTEQPHPLSWWWSSKGSFKLKLTRAAFEDMIRDHVDRTVQLTLLLREEASRLGHIADSVILIGGSSRIPLIQRKLHEALEVEPRRWQKQDVAVALGAAWHANSIWGSAAKGPQLRPVAPAVPNWLEDVAQAEKNRDVAQSPLAIPPVPTYVVTPVETKNYGDTPVAVTSNAPPGRRPKNDDRKNEKRQHVDDEDDDETPTNCKKPKNRDGDEPTSGAGKPLFIVGVVGVLLGVLLLVCSGGFLLFAPRDKPVQAVGERIDFANLNKPAPAPLPQDNIWKPRPFDDGQRDVFAPPFLPPADFPRQPFPKADPFLPPVLPPPRLEAQPAKAPNAQILRVTHVYDQVRNRQNGMVIEIDADVNGLGGQSVNFAAFFFYPNGGACPARNVGMYRASNGQLTTQQREFLPNNAMQIRKSELFIPQFQLDGGMPGHWNFMYQVHIQHFKRTLDRSPNQDFQYSWGLGKK